nr:DNA translocase FtsK [uncultured Dorea sp.]
MAAKSTKKKTSGKSTGKTTKNRTTKTSQNRKTTARKSKAASRQVAANSFIHDEIIIWATLAVSIIILISNFGVAGFIGEAISEILQSVFGVIAYVIPFLLFGMVSFLISNRGNKNAHTKIIFGIVLVLIIETLFELIDYMGGKIGAFFVSILTPAIGVAGTYVVSIILMIICIVLITEKSALKGVKAGSGKAYIRAKEDAKRRKQLSEERRREREIQRAQREAQQEKAASQKEMDDNTAKRREKYVEGVSFDTSIAKKSPEVRELPIDPKRAKGPEKPEFIIHRAEPVPDEMQEEMYRDMSDKQPVEKEMDVSESAQMPEEPDVVAEEKPAKRKNPKMGAAGMASEVASVEATVAADQAKPKKAYQYPPISLLKKGKRGGGESDAHLRETAMKLQQTLENFGVNVTITNVSCGPSVTRYELQPEMGVKVSKIVGLADDIKLNLAAADIRIEAPIPGKAAVGIEVPNKENSAVMLRDLLESPEFQNSTSKISFAVGKDIGGKTVVTDIAKMPHVLIAGATGSGKSVCINTLIMSILYKAAPDEVKLIMIDPKVVELSVYNGIPHLLIPVVTDPKKAAGALNWAVAEMSRRYQAFAKYNVRDMKGYNEKIKSMGVQTEDGEKLEPMPQIIIIVDELADLMMVAPGDVEEAICRLAQLARAAGIHLVIATQRPSVNVITGLIKANMPSRIAFSVSSGVDSRTIIDMNGAEKLLGKGDMLFYPSGYQKPARVQGSFVTDKEVQQVVEYLRENNGDVTYSQEIENHVNTAPTGGSVIGGSSGEDENDAYFADAGRLIIEKEKASIGMLQRAFKIGFNRAARIMDQLCEAGAVGPEEGTKPRKVLMSSEEFEQYLKEKNS